MKNLALGLSLLGAVLGSQASADTMDELVGNVAVVDFADGVEIRYYFHADNTFTASWHDGELTGSWYLQGEDICIDVSEDSSAPECEDYPKDKQVGDSWTQRDDDDGSLISIRIEPGDGASTSDSEDEQASDEASEPQADAEEDVEADADQDMAEDSEDASEEDASEEDSEESGEDDAE